MRQHLDDDTPRTLRRRLARIPRGRGKRFPAEARQQVAAWAVSRRAGGATWSELGTALGIRVESLRRWTATTRRSPVPVEVIMTSPVAASAITLHSPTGFRIEGLSAAEAVAALQALG